MCEPYVSNMYSDLILAVLKMENFTNWNKYKIFQRTNRNDNETLSSTDETLSNVIKTKCIWLIGMAFQFVPVHFEHWILGKFDPEEIWS